MNRFFLPKTNVLGASFSSYSGCFDKHKKDGKSVKKTHTCVDFSGFFIKLCLFCFFFFLFFGITEDDLVYKEEYHH